MLTALLPVSCFIAWLAHRKSKNVSYGLRGHIRTKLWTHTAEFAGILAGVLALYHIPLAAIYWGWPFVTVEKLVLLESFLTRSQTFVSSTLKLGWTSTFIILIAICLLDLWGVAVVESGRASKWFKTLRKELKLLNKVALLLCAFTLLGQDAGRPAASLEVRLRSVRHEYGVLRAEVKEALSQAVGLRIAQRALDQFPPAYQEVSSLVSKRDSAIGDVSRSYKDFRTNFGVANGPAESVARETAARKGAGERAKAAVDGASRESAVEEPIDADSSFRNIEAARETVGSYASRLSKIARSQAARDLAAHLPKLITSKLSANLVRLIAAAHPEIGPALEVVTETLDDGVAFKINEAADRIAKRGSVDPVSVADELDAGAKQIENQAKVLVSPSERRDALNQISALRAETVRVIAVENELKATETRLNVERGVRAASAPRQSGISDEEVASALVSGDSRDVAILRAGLAKGWVVTRNGAGIVFVHAESGGGFLSDLRYLVEEGPDGNTWTLHEPGRSDGGESVYGRKLGVMERPAGADIGDCTCR